MERAALSLAHRPDVTVTDIAYHFGFTDSAVSSRSFLQNLQPVVADVQCIVDGLQPSQKL
jgi:AraC-like DNA-binding protein